MTTDKQIIIDGIDIGECPYYCGHDICKNTCHYFSTPCEWVDVQNCTYKQFIQAEQTVEECHKYQAELEQKLKAENDELKKFLKDGGLHNLSLMAEKRVLLQTLAEIKELIQSDYCTEIGSCEFCAEIGDCLNRKILQKISECEVEK